MDNYLYRFYCTINSIETEVFPLNFNSVSLVYEREDKQIFFRINFKGKLVFIDRQIDGITDYTYFKNIETITPCDEISLLIKRSCDRGKTYVDYWNGYFSANDGEWDLDNCIVSFEPKTDDNYRCIIENEEAEINILDAQTIEASTIIVQDYEFYTCRDTEANCNASRPAPTTTWRVFHTETIDGVITTIYYREQMVTACIAGVPQPPPGAGWEEKDDNCTTTGLARYTRLPVIVYPVPNPDVSAGDCTLIGSNNY